MILKTKMSLLFVRGKPWVKRESEWDVTMGSFDGAEVCELTGLFMLDQLKQTNLDLGLYRDDGLGVTNLQGRPLEAKRQQIQQIFRQHELRVTIFSNLTVMGPLLPSPPSPSSPPSPMLPPSDTP